MSCVVFETPGLIDLKAFTLMGVSAKPNSGNPIGYFGTGLKYAMAVLVRLGAEPVVWVGKDKYTFQKSQGKFRGKEYEGLRMKREAFSLTRARYIELPYTVSYGRNWEAWMTFRELESNTRDEGGVTEIWNQPHGYHEIGKENYTQIIIDLPAFTEAYEKRDDIFLPGAVREGSGIQTMHKECEHLYWRGLRVANLGKPSVLTYNFLDHLQLTEDRTLQSEYYTRILLGNWVVQSTDEASIEKIITAGDKFWESGIEYPKHIQPSLAFHNVMLRHPKRARAGAWDYYAGFDKRVVEKTYDLFDAHPVPWKVEGTVMYDAKGRAVFDAPYNYVGKWELAAAAIQKRINMEGPISAAEEVEEPLGDQHEEDDDVSEQAADG